MDIIYLGARTSRPHRARSAVLCSQALADARASNTRSRLLATLFRKQRTLNQLANDVADQIVRFLDSLGIIAWNNQRQITKRGHRSSVATQQSDDSYFLLAPLFAGDDYIRRISGG